MEHGISLADCLPNFAGNLAGFVPVWSRMGRTAQLEPRYDWRVKRWILSIPRSLSPTGKRRQERFKTRESADGRAATLKALRDRRDESFAKYIRPDLVRDALECEELASSMGFDGLRHAFMAMAEDWERRQRTMSFGALLEAFEADRSPNWSDRYRVNRWKPFRKRMQPLWGKSLGTMDSDFWRAWLKTFRENATPAPATYNQILGMLRGLFAHEKALAILSRNPLDPMPHLKLPSKTIEVFHPSEVAALLRWTQQNDSDLLPYFALGCFAGLRPLAEIAILKFEHINLSEGLIDVHTTKTVRSAPRRQVPIEQNLSKWLAPYSRKTGPVMPQTNFRRRFEAARNGAAEALDLDGFPWADDIMRHSYGSYWDAAHRGQEGYVERLMYQMGHSSRKTFEQHYHNHRNRKEAEAYWSIIPPQEDSVAIIA